MRKKLLFLTLSLAMVFTLVACGSSTSANSENDTAAKDEPIVGTYNNVTFMQSSTFTLNENNTYDRTLPNEKGTYKTSKNGFTLTDADDDDDTVFAKEGNYYYRTNLICCFEEDEDYGLAPTFDDNGKSDQWFCAYYDTISDNSWNVIILQLHEDGTFKLRDCVRDGGEQTDGTVYEGTYTLDDNVLNLNCADNQVMPFLLIDEKLYFDVFVKE